MEIKDFIRSKWGSTDPERFPGPQPVSIERKHFKLLTRNRYLVCEKTDGTRHFLISFMIGNKKVCALVDRLFSYTLYNGITVPKDTLLDGELLGDTFIVHDAVCIGGKDLKKMNLLERLDAARDMIRKVVPVTHLTIYLKKMVPLSEIRQVRQDYTTDGLIFTPIDEPIRMGTHLTLFKWKPLEKITIDFWVTKQRDFYIQDQYICGPMKINQTECIAECCYRDGHWELVKIRKDKIHPNNKRTYERTMRNIEENIKIKEFCSLVPLILHDVDTKNVDRSSRDDSAV